MKLCAFLKPVLSRHRALLTGVTTVFASLGLSGCDVFESSAAKEEREAKEALEKKEKSLEKARTHSKTAAVHPVYTQASATATPGNPGNTVYSLTGPNGAQTSITVPGFADNMDVADLDNNGFSGDGVLAMSATHNVTVIRLAGNTPQTPVQYSTGSGTSPVAVAAGDVNGDHFTDLITANAGTYVSGNFVPGNLSLLTGTGNGSFNAATNLTAGSSPGDVAMADFNGDGKLDLAVANGSSLNGEDITAKSVIVRLNTGNGTFGPEIPVATAQRALALKVVDWNGDGKADIVTTGSILIGRGDGTFETPVNIAPALSPSSVLVQDVNGDGKADIVLGNNTPDLAIVLPGHGDGTSGPPLFYQLRSSSLAVACMEMVAEGASDLVFTDGSSTTILPGRRDGTFEGVRALPSVAGASARQSAAGAVVADFTGDGIPDIVVANEGYFGSNPASLLPGTGGGKFGSPVMIPGITAYNVVGGDWNGDTKPDVAFVGTGTASPVLMVAANQGGGVFGPFTTTALPGLRDSVRSTLITAFVNADTIPDLIVANMGHGDVSVFLGNGSGGFSAQAAVPVGPDHGAAISDFGVTPGGIATGDFNGDHHLDMVVTYEGDFATLNGGVKIALGNGDGTFKTPTTLRSDITAEGVAAGDFNKDGRLDFALAFRTQGWDVAVYLGQGDGTFASPLAVGLTGITLVSAIIAMDGDQDGKLDLAVTHGNGTVTAFRGLGDGKFVSVLSAPIGGLIVMAADLNQDGWPDLLAPNNYVDLYLNQLSRFRLGPPFLTLDSASHDLLVEWPDDYPDYTLAESPDLSTPFSPTTRTITTANGFFRARVNPGDAAKRFFRLKEK